MTGPLRPHFAAVVRCPSSWIVNLQLRPVSYGRFLIALFAARVCAQSIGTISGFVTDQSGALVPKARVTATLVE